METELSRVVNAIPGFVWSAAPDGRVDFLNQRWCDYTGVSLEDARGWGWQAAIHPDDVDRVLDYWRSLLESGRPGEFEARLRRFDGTFRWFLVSAVPLRDQTGILVKWYGQNADIEDRKRAEALLAGQKRFLEMVAGGCSLTAVLEALCKLVEDAASGSHCSVVLVDPSGKRLEHGAAPSLPASFIDFIIGRPVSADAGPSAMSVYLNEQVIAADITTDTRWASHGWCPMALAHGVQACWATPFSSSAGKVLGAFAIYYDKPTAPTSLHQSLIEQFRHIASIAVERAQSDAALKRSEARKAAILDSALDCIVTIDQEGCITEFNPAAERTFGYRRDEVLGKQLADVIVPPSLREKHRRGLARYLATGEARVLARRVEMTGVRADGSEIPVELAITRIPLDGPPSFTGYLRDITEHKQAVDERKRAEIRLAGEKRLLEMVASGHSLLDVLTALCRFVEDTATECYCGVYLIDWSGPRLREVAAPSLPATFNDPIHDLPVVCETGPCARAACLKTQVIAVDVESDPLWQASPFRPLALAHGLRSCWSTPIYSLAGNVLGTFAVLQRKPASPTPLQQDLIAQVTHIASIAIERAQGEAALKRSEAFLAEGQRLSSTGTFSWRVATDEITWSEQLYRIYEFDPALPLTNELIHSRIHPQDIPSIREMADRARGGDVVDFGYEHRLQMPDGSVKYLNTVAHGTRDQDGRLEYIGAVQDVTERRLSEEALGKVRSELAHVARVTSLGALTASIAHEVNQPLSGILTNASTSLRMLAEDPPNIEGARETARRTIRDANRAAAVISRLRALFRKTGASVELLDLNEATREVLALMSSELQRAKSAVRAVLADDLPLVMGDRVQLQQVVMNLVLNAAEAMSVVEDRPRQILVRTERDEADYVRFTVQDLGPGFDPQSSDRLFDAFYTTKRDGMGIGLSISRSIIESLRGRLWAALNDGPGATFAFTIPCVPAHAPLQVTGPLAPPRSSIVDSMIGNT